MQLLVVVVVSVRFSGNVEHVVWTAIVLYIFVGINGYLFLLGMQSASLASETFPIQVLLLPTIFAAIYRRFLRIHFHRNYNESKKVQLFQFIF